MLSCALVARISSSFSSTSLFFFSCSGDLRDLHSFPTRRSSDLLCTHWWISPARRGRVPRPLSRRGRAGTGAGAVEDRKSTRLNSSHRTISYAVFCLKKKKQKNYATKTLQLLAAHIRDIHHLHRV